MAWQDKYGSKIISAEKAAGLVKSGDLNRAQAAWQQVIEAGQDDDAMLRAARGLLGVASESASVADLAPALEIVARLDPEPETRHGAARQLVELYEGELNDPVRALPAWHALMDSAWAEQAIAKLEVAYEERQDEQGLADVMDRKADLTDDPAEARALNLKAVELRSRNAADRAEVIAVWRSFVERHGPSEEAYAKLMALLEQDRQWEELCVVLEQAVELAAPDARAALLGRLGDVRLTHLDDLVGALEAFRQALAIDPSDKIGRKAVEGLLGSELAGAAAAIILEPIYRTEGAHSVR